MALTTVFKEIYLKFCNISTYRIRICYRKHNYIKRKDFFLINSVIDSRK